LQSARKRKNIILKSNLTFASLSFALYQANPCWHTRNHWCS